MTTQSDFDEKALRRRSRLSDLGGRVGGRVRRGRGGSPKRIQIPRTTRDGDGDGKRTNPFTGEDDIPVSVPIPRSPGRPRRQISAELTDLVVSMLADGKTYAEIEKTTGLSNIHISRIRDAAGGRERLKRRRDRPGLQEQLDLAYQMLVAGKTPKEIFAATDLSSSAIYAMRQQIRKLQSSGLPLPAKRPLPEGKRHRRLSSETKDQVVSMLADGRTFEEIAEETGVSLMTVTRINRELGGRTRPPSERNKRVLDQRDLIVDMLADGKTEEEIARATGVSRSAVSRISAQIGGREKPARRQNRRTLEQRDLVVSMLADGKTFAEITEATGLSRAAIAGISKDVGGRPKPSQRKNRRTRAGALTPEQKNQIKEGLAAGKSPEQVAKDNSLTLGQVVNFADANNIKLKATSRSSGKMTPEKRAELIRMRSAGMTNAEIAYRLDVSKSIVMIEVRKAGLAREYAGTAGGKGSIRARFGSQIAEMVRQGKSNSEIAEALGLKPGTVQLIVRELNEENQRIKARKPLKRRSDLSADDQQRLVDMVINGDSVEEIAKALKLKKSEARDLVADLLGTKRQRISKADGERIIKLRKTMSLQEIADVTGYDESTISRFLKRARGAGQAVPVPERRDKPRGRPSLSIEQRLRALDLIAQGLTYTEIAQQLNVSVSTISVLARGAGEGPRPRGRPKKRVILEGAQSAADRPDRKDLIAGTANQASMRRVILVAGKQLGPRLGDAGKPLIDGDGDGKCREVGDKFVPCPPGVPAGTLLGRLTEAIDPLEGIDLEQFRVNTGDTDEDLAYNLERQAKFEDWQQWEECRSMRRHAFDIVASGPGAADPHVGRDGPNLFGDPRYKTSIDESKMRSQAQYLLAELARTAQSGEESDRPLYRAVKLPSDPEDFMRAFEEGSLVDLPLLATSTARREGPNEFLTRYGSDVLLEIQGPTVGLTGGPIVLLAEDHDEQVTIQALEDLAEQLQDALDFDLDDDEAEIEEGREDFIKKLRSLLEEYEDAREKGAQARVNKAREALREIAQDYGLTDQYYFAGDEINDYNVADYWDRMDDLGESGQREVITGGRFRVVKVEPDPDGVYKTRIILEHVGTFDPRVRGGLIPVRRTKK